MNIEIILLYNIYIRNIIKYNTAGCFLVNLTIINITVKLFKKTIKTEWTRYIWKTALIITVIIRIIIYKYKLSNNITVYNIFNTVNQL